MSPTPAPKPAQLIISSAAARIYNGRAEDWEGEEWIDLVFTNPYGPLPTKLIGKPMIVHQWCHRTAELARWCHVRESDLRPLATWNRGREGFYTINLETFPVDIARFNPEPGGWYPPDLVAIILSAFWMQRRGWTAEELEARAGRPFTVWDGFMGRATIGRVAIARHLSYIGVEELGAHIDLAVEYLSPLP